MEDAPTEADEMSEEITPPPPEKEGGDVHDFIRFKWGNLTYQFGLDCYYEFVKGDGEDSEVITKRFARNVWPGEVYEHVDEDEHGVRFEYVTHSGGIKHGTMSASGFVNKSSGKRATEDAADNGVDIATGSDHEFAYALGRWREAHTKKAPVVKVASQPGWRRHGTVYVNGEDIHTNMDKGWHADGEIIAIKRRSQRAGSLEDWIFAVEEEVTTPGLRAALGTSLAGPLIGLMHLHPFFTHIYGSSSCGKSTAGRVAASVWSSPLEEGDGLFQSWSASPGGFELICASADGACLVLDELGKYSGRDDQFAKLIHTMTSKKGRVTMTRNRSERASRSWSITGVSTGEISMAARIGDYLQGGQMVRMMDLDVEPGEVTTDGPHADRVSRAFASAHGVVGDRWVEYLVSLPNAQAHIDEWIATWRNRLRHLEDGTAEGGRILSHVHLIGAAIGLSREAGIIPWSESEDEDFLVWMGRRIMEDREDKKTPNERALELWYTMVDTMPAAFPFEGETGSPRELFGHKEKVHHKLEVWTSERMIRKSGLAQKAGVTPRKWLSWCVEQGHCREEDNVRYAGRQKRWKVFKLD